jgi:hypothetical protein
MIDVRVAPLDDFPDRIEGRLALKVDTQGAEPFVVAGARACLPRSDFSMEFCPYLMRQLGSDSGIVMDLVAGFDRVAIMDKTWTLAIVVRVRREKCWKVNCGPRLTLTKIISTYWPPEMSSSYRPVGN